MNLFVTLRRLIVLVPIAAACVLLVWVSQKYAPGAVSGAQLAAHDFLFVRADGPGLGRRPVDPRIALVLFDVDSSNKLGFDGKYQNDLALYQALFNAGAKAVYDTRLIAVGNAEILNEVRPLLDGMKAINDEGRLIRDVWFTAEMSPELVPAYGHLSAQNIVNSEPHVLASQGPRLYPLVNQTAGGPKETAPLVIARKVWGLDPPDARQIVTQLLESGAMEQWHLTAPKMINKPETTYARGPYIMGDHRVTWHPFASSNILVPPCAFWVSFDPRVSEYARFSYAKVIEKAEPASFRDKIVLVGFSADMDPFSDTYEIPCEPRKAAAAELVAAAVQTLLDGRNMESASQGTQYLALGLLTFTVACIGGYLRPLPAMAAALAAFGLYYSYVSVLYWRGWAADCAAVPLAGLVSFASSSAYNAYLNVRSRRRIVDLFGRYVPRAVVDQMMQKSQVAALAMEGEKREVTVMFADIRGFTSFSEDMPPETVLKQLNSLLEIMVECVFEYQGTLDKFIGDAILVLFNAPLAQPDHTERAIRVALNIQRRLKDHATGLSVGIGVHRGEAVVGNVGTPQRLEYTAIGSTVNITSRLCDFAKPGEIVTTQALLKGIPETCSTEPLGSIQVKGIKQAIEAYKVLGWRESGQQPTTQATKG